MSYDIRQVDWTKYLDREQPLILFVSTIRPYGSLMQSVTGAFRFTNQLQVFSGTSGTMYKSSQELQSSHNFFAQLIQDGDPRLVEWQQRGIQRNQEIGTLLALFTDNTPIITPENARKLYKQYEETLLYDVMLPFRIMACIDHELEIQGELTANFQKTRDLFESFRAGSQYPKVLQIVFPHFYKAVNKKWGIPEGLCSLMTPDELLTAIEGENLVSVAELEKRGEWCVFWEDPETGKIEFSYDPNLIKDLGLIEETEGVTEFAGKTAFAGKVTGMVKVINNDREIDKVNEGDIIVSFNTNPSLMPALRKCAGIVTNEGGIMCHAAIIARELGKPCIIGTKIATQVLKDGDLVEVDAEQGVVRVIEKSK